MAGLLESLAGGLKAAGGALNPQVYQDNNQEMLARQQQDAQARNMLLQQMIRGIESGAITPPAGHPLSGIVGMTPQARAQQLGLEKEKRKVEYLQSPEAMQFIEKQDDIGLIRDMARRGLIPIDDALKAIKESRSVTPIGAGGAMRADGTMIPPLRQPAPAAPHTQVQDYIDPADGQRKQRILQHDPSTNTWVPAVVNDGKPQGVTPIAPDFKGIQPASGGGTSGVDPMAEIMLIQNPKDRQAAFAQYQSQLSRPVVSPETTVNQPQPLFRPTPASKAPSGYRYKDDGKTLEPIPGGPKDPAILAEKKAPDSVVDLIARGDMAMPTGFALRSPYWQDVIERVTQKDPNFSGASFNIRSAAKKTFVSGPEARNVTALNTVIGHLGTLDEAATALNNGDIRVANAVVNRIGLELGKPEVVNFQTAKEAVAEETMRVFRQVGASEAEAKRWGDIISVSNSPAQLRGNIATLGKLLDSRVEAIGRQYERTTQSGQNPAVVDPKNRITLDKLKGGASSSELDAALKRY